MLYDRVKLFFQSLFNRFRQIVTVPRVCPVPAKLLQFFVRTVNMRSICACGNRSYHLYHIGNSVCVCNNDFLRLFFTEISKFLKHFLGSPEIKRRLVCKIVIALSCLQHLTEYSVLRIFEMHVTGSNYRLSEPVTKLDNCTVEISQILFTAYLTVSK